MFRPATQASRVPAFRPLTALLLLASLGAFQASHLKHHYDHAAPCHAHDGHPAAVCIVFHTGTLAEGAFEAPRAGAAAIARVPTAEVRALGLLILPVREARAPPVCA
ncbi:MAG: hypothetical protein Q7W56_10430 [Candidatus Latescibacteria bacterium]|nr:hypothetical protein [Candidatus Latescibacterota bacterium]